MNGILLVDKPAGMTSHDVVDEVRRAARMRRVGHTGTLDPRATGLLVLCLGHATRLSEHLTGLDKTYEGAMRLGVVTDSHDLDGNILEENPVGDYTLEDLQAVCSVFTGQIDQIPPMVSAVKVGGQRLYKMARKGEKVERQPRRVTVYEFDVQSCEKPDVRIRVRCSSGTYVRTLCDEAGRKLGCGAALSELRRTRVGSHSVANAVTLDSLNDPDDVNEHLVPPEDALNLPEVVLRNANRASLASGRTLTETDLCGECPVQEGWVQVKSESGELLALAVLQAGPETLLMKPKRVFMKERG